MSGRTSELTAGRPETAAAAYESFYGFAEAPFSLAPGVRFAFMSRSYTAALEEVRRALARREAFVVVTGEIGTGKTMLCRAIASETDAQTFVSFIADPCLSAEEMLTQVLTDFGVMGRSERGFRTPAADRHQLLITFQRFLASLAPLGGRAVVIVDEAQHMHPAVLEQIRLWANLNGDQAARLQIVLAGQPELDEILERPELRQLRQRVSRRCELTRLGRDEVARYLDHRLSVARGDGSNGGGVLMQSEAWRVRFTPAASRRIAAVTRGIPRLVNLVADRALEIGCERRARNIDVAIARAAARRLHLLAPAIPRAAIPAAAAAAVMLIAGGAWSWQTAAGWSVATPLAAGLVPGWATDATDPAGEETSTSAARATETLAVADSVNVSIASFRTEQRAATVAAQLVDAGFPAFTRRDATGLWHQVIVGPYLSADEAAAAQQALRTHGVGGSEVRLQTLSATEVGR